LLHIKRSGRYWGDGVEIESTRHGPAAVNLLASQVAELKGSDPLSHVTVVVTSNYAAVATRRDLAARCGGIANVHFTTVREIAHDLGAAQLGQTGRQAAYASLIIAAFRAALHETPGVFGPVANHPATEQALAKAYRELRRISETAATAVAERSARASDVVRICREAHERLAGRWYDDEDLLAAAANKLESAPHPEIGPVIVHLLPELSASEARFLHALDARSPLQINVGITGNPAADRPVFSAYERSGITLSIPDNIDPPCASRIISASDPDDEVRAAVRLITQWAQDGIRLGRIALLYGNAEPYAGLTQAQLDAAGIAFTGMPTRSLGDMLLGRTLRALLALPDRAFRRPDVLAVLADAPILDNGHPAPYLAWERLSREAGVVSGEDWSRRLSVLASKKRQRADEYDASGDSVRAEYCRRDADRSEALDAFVQRLRDDLSVGAEANTWAGLVEWATGLLRTYLGDETRRANWSEDDQDAALQVEELVRGLAELDAVGGPSPNLAVFRQAIDSALKGGGRQIGRLGAGVLFGHVSVAAGMTFERIIVLGMAEGSFPPRRLEDSLLPDAERAAAGGHLKLRTELVHDDHLHLLAAVAGADEAVFSWPRGDLRQSSEEPASRWLLADAGRLAGMPGLRSADLLKLRNEPWFENIASFADGMARTEVFSSDQELRVAAIARGEPRSPVLTSDTTLSRALETISARASQDFTRFDGNLTAATANLAQLQRVSATQLQTWAACPRSYLFKYMYGVEPVEEPERRLSIDALERGTLFHAILEEFVQDAIDSGHPMTSWSADDRQRLHEIAHRHFGRFRQEGHAGRELIWRRDQSGILAELDRTLDLDNQRLGAGLRPVAAEHRFDLVEIPMPGGRALHLHGSIDRIDQHLDGALEIIDYKTGKHYSYKGLSEDTPHDGGKRLQLYIYALAGRQQFPGALSVTASYWFTETNQLIGYQVTERVEQDVAAAIHTIVDGIESGVFPAHPSGKKIRGWVDCWFCTPDGLSSAEARREWKQMRHDPALAAYRALSQPEAVE
jgi:ATP-dependent helicase/nuclease subunit B